MEYSKANETADCRLPQQARLVWNAVDADLSQLKFTIVSNTGLILSDKSLSIISRLRPIGLVAPD
jgi:hypothetical protein